VYARLAGALVAGPPVSLAGALVLDLGAGTGLAGRAALAAGARQVVRPTCRSACCATPVP